MTRRSVYGVASVAFLAAMAMTIASIIIPRWISWDQSVPGSSPVHVSYGLHQRCSSLTSPASCTHFPSDEYCQGSSRQFCNLWRSVGFLLSFAVVLEGMTFVTFVVLLVSGKQKREGAWWVLCGFLLLVAAVEVAGMAMVAYVLEHDPRFIDGFRLDISWILSVVSGVLVAASAIGVATSKYVLEPEGGYELIPDSELRT